LEGWFKAALRDSIIVEHTYEPGKADLPLSQAARQRHPTRFKAPEQVRRDQ
jgi:hypothetical protein